MTSKYNKIFPMLTVAALAVGNASAEVVPDSLDTQVPMAFRTIAKSDMLAGAETLDFEKLMEVNYINDLNNGTISGYVSGFNGNSLWGMDGDNDGFLVLIDGVARDLNNVISTEVKSITFMKGAAATVLYGSRAAKGVIYVETKRGKNAPLTVTARANTGWHVAKSYPEYLGSAEYMTLYNEARANDGLGAAYTPEEIYNTAAGVNPYLYPDVNMYSKDYVKKAYNRSDASVEIQGGNERARYYTNINYFRQSDFLKFGEAKKDYTDRFSVRGNIDVDITSFVSAYVNASATFYNARAAHSNDTGNYWANAATLRPNRINPLIPVSMINPDATPALDMISSTSNIYDGYFLGGTQIDKTNIFADYLAKGYNKFTSRQFQFDTGVNVNLGMLLKGLTFTTRYALDYATSYNTGYTNSYATFVPTWSNFNGFYEITSVSKEGKDEHSGVQNISSSSSRQTMYFSAQFDYKRTFGDAHNINATLVGAGWQRSNSGQYHKTSNVNLGLEVDYNYDRRYYVDLALTGVHSAKLAPGHRQAWSPSATLGWRISNEEFMKNQSVVDDLLLYASGSILHSDQDIENYYMYSANYTNGGWYSWAVGGQAAAYPKRGANEKLTFVKRKELNFGIRSEFFNRMIGLNASYFVYTTEGLIGNNSSKFPTYFSTYYPEASFVPYMNMNDNKRTGFDFGVNFKKEFGDFSMNLGVTGTYYDTKATKRDEIYEDEYQYRKGKAIDGIWGYRCLGFFETDEEAAAANQGALGGGTLKAGDLKYEDVNGDGKVDSQDQVFLAKGGWYGSPFFMGVNLSLSWKGLTLFVHGLGNFGGHATLNGNSYYRPTGENKYSVEARNRWTPETAATATLPRLTTGNGDNNYVTSDFWIYSTRRFDIDKIQLTYDFPKSLIHGPIVKGLQVYVSGDDLVTFGKYRKILERNTGGSPYTRFYNIGAQVTF